MEGKDVKAGMILETTKDLVGALETYDNQTVPTGTAVAISNNARPRYCVKATAFDSKNQRIFLNVVPPYALQPLKTPIAKLGWSLERFFKLFPMNIGSDPEVFVGNGKGGVIPAWELFPKTAAYHNSPYWDGLQAEFRTQAQHCTEYLTDDFQLGLSAIRAKGPLLMDSTVKVSDEIFKNAKPEHIELGCMPSVNAYGKVGEAITNGRMLPYRFAGMHMHFGAEFFQGRDNLETSIDGVKALDKTLGVVLTAIGGHWENPIRRNFYGLPGEYRRPKHGLEYRVPASWVMKHPALVHLAFDLARFALNLSVAGMMDVWDVDEDEACEVITESNSAAALQILGRKKNKVALNSFLEAAYCQVKTSSLEKANNVFWRLLEKDIKIEDNMDKHWKLTQGEWEPLSDCRRGTFRTFINNEGVA